MAKLRKEIQIWGRKLGLRASPLAPVCYTQEFGTSLTGDFLKLVEMEELGKKFQKLGNVLAKNPEKMSEHTDDFAKLESAVLEILKPVYAMNRADNFGKNFPEYEKWLNEFEYIDFTEVDWVPEVVTVIRDGFFRNGKHGGSKGTK